MAEQVTEPDVAPVTDPAPAAPDTVVTAGVTPDAQPDKEPAKEPAPADAEGKDGKPDDGKDADGDKPKEGAPEKYEEFTVPEGYENLDQAALDKFTPIAKELNLSQAQAQELVNLYATMRKEATDQAVQEWNDLQTEWRTAAKADKEIGGLKYDESVANAKRFLSKFGTSDLVDVLNTTGVGNHVEVIRAFSKAGKLLGEDKITKGDAGQPARTHAEILYPNMPS